MQDFQATHRELLQRIFYYVDDPIICKFVCKFWKKLTSEMPANPVAKRKIYASTLIVRAQTNLMKWAYSKGCPLMSEHAIGRASQNALIAAAKVGRFDIVEWAIGKGVDITSDAVRYPIAKHAAKFDDYSMINRTLMMTGSTTYAAIRDTCRKAVQYNHLILHEWIVASYNDNRVSAEAWKGKCCGLARAGKTNELVKEFDCGVSRGLALDLQPVLYDAIKGDHVDIVEWCLTRAPMIVLNTLCTTAAASGSIKVIMLLRKHGHDWSGTTYQKATDGGHHKLAKWLVANGCLTSYVNDLD